MISLIICLLLSQCYGFRTIRKLLNKPYLSRVSLQIWNTPITTPSETPISQQSEEKDDFDGNDFNKLLSKVGPVWTSMDKDNETVQKLRDEQIAREEDIYRVYPFVETKLPVLPDCNNYFSGKFGEYFWHQNADQVYVYIPIDESITKNDIDADFQAMKVVIKIKNDLEVSFKCLDKIIPDGSFWTFERDVDGKHYIQLDLEKRFRMINWKNLFGEPKAPNPAVDDANRKEMLEKLFSANKGMSKLMRKPAESMEEMMENKDIVKMLGQKYFPETEILGTEDGSEITAEDKLEVESIEASLDEDDDDKEEKRA